MKHLLKILAALLLAAVIIPACEVENCPPNALSYAVFVIKDATGATAAFADTISIIGVMEDEDGNLVNDTLVNKDVDESTFSLPLSYADQTLFVFVYYDESRDTITVTHRNIPYFFNVDCGSMMYYEVTDVQTTYHQIDSIVLVNANITNNETNNFYVYYPSVAD